MRAVVLCGGIGTRLGLLTKETPKPLLHVGNKPFLLHVLEKLRQKGISHVCLAVSFQWTQIQNLLGTEWNGLQITYSIEEQQLGTGGAVKKALAQMNWPEAFVVNGDSLVDIDFDYISKRARVLEADIVMVLKSVNETSRYGCVSMALDSRVIRFEEKNLSGPGLINTGIYWIRQIVLQIISTDIFSLEKDVIASHISTFGIFGIVTEGYFIDIGIPEDLERARRELAIL